MAPPAQEAGQAQERVSPLICPQSEAMVWYWPETSIWMNASTVKLLDVTWVAVPWLTQVPEAPSKTAV